MKPLSYLTGLILLLATMHSTKANATGKKHYLQMIGTLQQDMNTEATGLNLLSGAMVTITDKLTRETITSYSDSTGTWKFKLALNNYYILKISKNGFVTKTIKVNTKVPANKLKDYDLPFDVFMFEKIDDIDASVLRNPIASVQFNGYYNYFIYNYSYTDMVNERLKKVYTAYYNRHKMKPDSMRLVMPSINPATNLTINTPHAVNQSSSNIRFHVQLIATNGPRVTTCAFFSGFSEVAEYKADGLYKYAVGNFRSLSQAQALKIALRDMGYTDAFIVAEKDEKRIPVQEALAELKR